MFCKNCGSPIDESASFCMNCGVPVDKEEAGSATAGDTICHENSEAKQESPKDDNRVFSTPDHFPFGNINGISKLGLAILCFFLGTIGIHNFVLGEVKKGVFKIIMTFCCGISVIFMLIDFVKILIDKYEVNTNTIV